jgi:hypothetical protein
MPKSMAMNHQVEGTAGILTGGSPTVSGIPVHNQTFNIIPAGTGLKASPSWGEATKDSPPQSPDAANPPPLYSDPFDIGAKNFSALTAHIRYSCKRDGAYPEFRLQSRLGLLYPWSWHLTPEESAAHVRWSGIPDQLGEPGGGVLVTEAGKEYFGQILFKDLGGSPVCRFAVRELGVADGLYYYYDEYEKYYDTYGDEFGEIGIEGVRWIGGQ